MHAVRCSCRLKINHVILVGCCQSCPGMPKVLPKTNCQYLRKGLSGWFFACSRVSIKLKIDPMVWVWCGQVRQSTWPQTCSKYSKTTNSKYLQYLIIDLILNGEYSESVSSAQSQLSNQLLVCFVYKLINLWVVKYVSVVYFAFWFFAT